MNQIIANKLKAAKDTDLFTVSFVDESGNKATHIMNKESVLTILEAGGIITKISKESEK